MYLKFDLKIKYEQVADDAIFENEIYLIFEMKYLKIKYEQVADKP